MIFRYAKAMARSPNRIHELRKAHGLSRDELGRLAGTTANTIRRLEMGLENGGMELTVSWMRTLAPLLDVMPADLMTFTLLAETQDEVVAADDDPLAESHAALGVRVYRVTEAGHSLDAIGIKPGDTLLADEAPERISNVQSLISDLKGLDVVILHVRSPEDGVDALVLREFVPPDLVISNTKGTIRVGRITDPRVQLKAVVIRK
jgi:transcriptional regulator with XRE-family HTH domain